MCYVLRNELRTNDNEMLKTFSHVKNKHVEPAERVNLSVVRRLMIFHDICFPSIFTQTFV